MENNILLRPHPTVTSYLKHFQLAQRNLSLFVQEERERKKKKKLKAE
jgi:hypothetical protein